MILEAFKNTLFEKIDHLDTHYSTHFHDTYTIGITRGGLFKSIKQNNTFIAYKTSTRILNPFEAHTGKSVDWDFTNFYPSTTLMSEIYKQIFYESRVPFFAQHLIEDITLYTMLLKLFENIYGKEDTLVIETNLIETLSYLVLHYADCTTKSPMPDDSQILQNSIEFINDSLCESISLDDLATLSNLSKYHFLRVFKKQYGTTPHNYILTQRVHLATQLLVKGIEASSASLQAGFSDQSHFIRSFRKIYGYPPSHLFKSSNIFLYR